MAFSVNYIYRITDQYSSKLAKIRKQTDKFTKAQKKASKASLKLGRNLQDQSSKLGGLLGTMATGAAFLFPVSKAVAFEAQMANVKKVLNDITPKEFADLTKVIKTSAVQLGRVPVAVAQIAEQAGKTGVPVREMGKFIELVAKTAISFDMLDQVAGQNLGQLRTRLKLSVGGVEELMDSVNFMADNTSASGDRMIEIIGRLSGDFLSIKMPKQLIAGWAAFADQIEVTPQLAASGLRQMLQRMEKLGFGEALLKDPSGAIKSFLQKFEKIDPGKRGQILQKVLGLETAKFAKKAIEQLDLLDSTLKKATGAEQFGSMTRELVTKTETAAFKLSQVHAVLTNMFIDIGGPILKVIKQLSPEIIRITKSVSEFIKVNPVMVRFGMVMLGLSAVIVPLTFVAGLLATVIGSLLTPVGAVVAGIVLFIGAVGSLAVGNKGLRDSLANLWDSIQPLLEPFKVLFNMLGGGEGIANGLAVAIDTIAAAVRFLLSPLKALYALGRGDFMGAFDAIREGSAGLMPDFSGMKDSLKMDFTDNRLASSHSKATAGMMNGDIRVSAEPGSRVSRANLTTSFPGNLGFNMEPNGA